MCKKLLVFSDTHGSVAALASVLIWAKALSPDAAVFLGDGLDDLESAAATTGFSCPWHKVRGNNDYGFQCQETAVFDLGDHRFFICHGHRYNLYRGTETLAAIARNNKADVALFGHTHVPFFEAAGGLLLMNPGSIGHPRSNAGATFALLECHPGEPPKPGFWGIDFEGNITAVPMRESF
ncbi:MAG: metallophosphoesterase [Treponema sp.]|nr:metallophosphoesterase [Treponema sp.]